MSHYVLHVPIEKEDVKIIKDEFHDYIDKVGAITIAVRSDTDVEPSPELGKVLRKLFLQLIICVDEGYFEGVH